MKTKHLFWALAMPTIFAACSNEDIEIPSQEVSGIMNRPMAGQVDLTVGLGGVDSRLDYNFQFEAGKDELGACLMDEYTPNNGHVTVDSKDFTLVDYIQTNYRYTLNKNGVWTNSTLLATGNYFFYYPYTAQLNARKSFEKYLNPRQVLASNTTAARRNLVNDNQMYAGHAFVQNQTEGDVSMLDGLTLQPVFAFPFFTLNNRDTEGLTITKIALQYIDDEKEWPLKAIIDPAAAIEGKTSYPIKTDAYGRYDLAARPVAAVKYSNTYDPNQLDVDAVVSAKQIEVVFPNRTIAKAGQSVKTYMVIPSGDYSLNSGNEVKLLIYTTEGLITAMLDKIHDNNNSENAGSELEEYNVTNTSAMDIVYGDVNLMAGNKYRDITISFDEMAAICPENLTVSSTEDLDMYIQWAVNKSGSNKTINAMTTGEQVELSKNACALLASNKLVSLNIYGDITIAADAPANAYELVNFTGLAQDTETASQTIYNKASLTIDDDKRFIQPEGGNVDLVNEGTIEFTGRYGAALNKVENKGTIIFSGNNSYNKITTVGSEFLNKYGAVVNVTAKKVEVESISNEGTLNVAADAELTGKIVNVSAKNSVTSALENAIVNINGTWTASAGSINKGDMNVAGIVNASGLTNQSYGFWYNWNTAYYSAGLYNGGQVLKLTNNGSVTIASATAIQQSAEGSKGTVNNTICSQMVTKLPTETIAAYITGEKKASYVADIVSRSNADRLYISGKLVADYDNSLIAKKYLTKETERNLKEWSYIVGEQSDLKVIVNGDLVVEGDVCIYENRGTNKAAEVTINSNKVLTIASYAHLWIGQEVLDVQGRMNINSSATVTATIRNMNNVICAGAIVGKDFSENLEEDLTNETEVTLEANTTIAGTVNIESCESFNLNGNTLTCLSGSALVIENAENQEYLISNGTIVADEAVVTKESTALHMYNMVFSGTNAVVMEKNTTVVLMNSTFNLEEGGLLVKNNSERVDVQVILKNVIINGIKIKSKEDAKMYVENIPVGNVFVTWNK